MWFFKKKRKQGDSSHKKHKEHARKIIVERIAYFAPICEVEYKRIAIRNTKRSWGSCSSLGNLNFNYKLLFLPVCIRDYIIIHELCHLKELNHSQKFWNHVESVIPNYKESVKELRKMEKTLGTSLAAIDKFKQSHNCDYCLKNFSEN